MVACLAKYCSVSTAVLILENGYFLLKPPNDFNDLGELSYKIDCSLSLDEKKEIVRKIVDGNSSYHRGKEFVDWLLEKENFHFISKQFKKEIDFTRLCAEFWISGFKASSGVTCFTNDINNVLMWSHYAESHKGVCIVFGDEKEPSSIIKKAIPVKYKRTLPPLRLFDFWRLKNMYADFKCLYENHQDLYCQLFEILTTKASQWKNEKEYRIVRYSPLKWGEDKDKYFFEVKDVSKIILGSRIDQTSREEILKVVQGIGCDEIYQAISIGRNLKYVKYDS